MHPQEPEDPVQQLISVSLSLSLLSLGCFQGPYVCNHNFASSQENGMGCERN